MANWPTSPNWIDPSTINSGNEYTVADGVTYEDFNKIVNNIIYLKNKGVTIPQEKSIAIISNGTQTVTPDEGHSLSKVTIVTNVPSQEPTGTLTITRNDTYEVSNYKYVAVNVPQSTSRPTLHAPTISLSGTTLHITNPAPNGSYVDTYQVYADGAYLTAVTSTSVNLANYSIEEGTHSITVKCAATDFNDSPASNAVTYKVLYTYTITTALSHVIADSTNPKTIKENASASLIFTAASGYELPETVTVTGCTYTWEPSTGVLNISNPTSNVAISISAIAVYQITTTLTGCTGASSNPSTIEQGGTATLTFTANTGYALPDTITVEGATHTWNKSTGTLTLSDPTGNVVITIVAIDITPQLATPQNVTANGTTVSWDEVENATSYDILADGVSIGTVLKQTGFTIEINRYFNPHENWDSGRFSIGDDVYYIDPTTGYIMKNDVEINEGFGHGAVIIDNVAEITMIEGYFKLVNGTAIYDGNEMQLNTLYYIGHTNKSFIPLSNCKIEFELYYD